MKEQKRSGVVLSYLNIVLGVCINLVVTPMLISGLSDEFYSIYKIIQAFAGSLIILNLGCSTIVARAIAKYNGAKNIGRREKENTLATAILLSVLMAVLVMLIGAGLSKLIPRLYGENYTAEMLSLSQKVFFAFLFSTALHIVSDAFKGCLIGNERFAVLYGIQTVQYVLKLVLVFAFLRMGKGVLSIALVEVINSVILLMASVIYSLVGLRELPRFHYFDKREMLEFGAFSLAILLQAIINQVNNNMDIVILGAMVSQKKIITMYSSALTIYALYNSLVSALASVYFPKATKLVYSGADGETLTDFVIGSGRIQAALAVGIVIGFALFGRNFITLWIGSKYIDAYFVTLLLIIPVTIPLVQNVCVSVLDARLKRLYRSIVLVIMALINLAVSIVLIRYIGFWGAAVGTCLSILIGHGFLMNRYYSRAMGFNTKRMFLSIFKGILPTGLLAGLICLPLACFVGQTAPLFILKCTVFLLIYVILLWKFGFNSKDKMLLGVQKSTRTKENE